MLSTLWARSAFWRSSKSAPFAKQKAMSHRTDEAPSWLYSKNVAGVGTTGNGAVSQWQGPVQQQIYNSLQPFTSPAHHFSSWTRYGITLSTITFLCIVYSTNVLLLFITVILSSKEQNCHRTVVMNDYFTCRYSKRWTSGPLGIQLSEDMHGHTWSQLLFTSGINFRRNSGRISANTKSNLVAIWGQTVQVSLRIDSQCRPT